MLAVESALVLGVKNSTLPDAATGYSAASPAVLGICSGADTLVQPLYSVSSAGSPFTNVWGVHTESMKSATCGAPHVVITSLENTGPLRRSPDPKQMPF